MRLLLDTHVFLWWRAGREMRYSVRVERLDATARWMAAAARRWDDRLAAIKSIAESGE